MDTVLRLCFASLLPVLSLLACQPLTADGQLAFGGVFDLNFGNWGRFGLAGGGGAGAYTPGLVPNGYYNPLYYSTYPYPYTATVPGLGIRYGYY